MSENDSDGVGGIIGVNNRVTDTSIITGLWISAIIGGSVMVLFCILQRKSVLYRYRLQQRNPVRIRPPDLSDSGIHGLIDWAVKAVTVSDLDLMQSAGLDAMLMVKLCSLGVKIFLPPCILGVCVLIPLHLAGGESEVTDASTSGFMRLTMSNIPDNSPVFWVHFVFVYLYLGWAMLLLRGHYHQYLTIRQHYIRWGDDRNVWQELFTEAADTGGARRRRGGSGAGAVVEDFLHNVPLIKQLMPTGIALAPLETLKAEAVDDEDSSSEDEQLSPGNKAAAQGRTSLGSVTAGPLSGASGPMSPSDASAAAAAAFGATSAIRSPAGALSPSGARPQHTSEAVANPSALLRRLPPPAYLTRMGSKRMMADGHLPSPLSRGQPRSPLSGPVDAASALHGSGRSMVHMGRRRSTAYFLPNGLSEGAHTIMLGAGKFNDPNASAFGASKARAMRRNATTMAPRMPHGQAAGNHWQHHVNHLNLQGGRPNSGSRLQHETHGSLATVFSGDLQEVKEDAVSPSAPAEAAAMPQPSIALPAVNSTLPATGSFASAPWAGTADVAPSPFTLAAPLYASLTQTPPTAPGPIAEASRRSHSSSGSTDPAALDPAALDHEPIDYQPLGTGVLEGGRAPGAAHSAHGQEDRAEEQAGAAHGAGDVLLGSDVVGLEEVSISLDSATEPHSTAGPSVASTGTVLAAAAVVTHVPQGQGAAHVEVTSLTVSVATVVPSSLATARSVDTPSARPGGLGPEDSLAVQLGTPHAPGPHSGGEGVVPRRSSSDGESGGSAGTGPRRRPSGSEPGSRRVSEGSSVASLGHAADILRWWEDTPVGRSNGIAVVRSAGDRRRHEYRTGASGSTGGSMPSRRPTSVAAAAAVATRSKSGRANLAVTFLAFLGSFRTGSGRSTPPAKAQRAGEAGGDQPHRLLGMGPAGDGGGTGRRRASVEEEEGDVEHGLAPARAEQRHRLGRQRLGDSRVGSMPTQSEDEEAGDGSSVRCHGRGSGEHGRGHSEDQGSHTDAQHHMHYAGGEEGDGNDAGPSGDEQGQDGAGEEGEDEQEMHEHAHEELVVSRSRPSVSLRKTVNAVFPDGRDVAVLAQLYAVLVMDVGRKEKKRRHEAKGKGAAGHGAADDDGSSVHSGTGALTGQIAAAAVAGAAATANAAGAAVSAAAAAAAFLRSATIRVVDLFRLGGGQETRHVAQLAAAGSVRPSLGGASSMRVSTSIQAATPLTGSRAPSVARTSRVPSSPGTGGAGGTPTSVPLRSATMPGHRRTRSAGTSAGEELSRAVVGSVGAARVGGSGDESPLTLSKHHRSRSLSGTQGELEASPVPSQRAVATPSPHKRELRWASAAAAASSPLPPLPPLHGSAGRQQGLPGPSPGLSAIKEQPSLSTSTYMDSASLGQMASTPTRAARSKPSGTPDSHISTAKSHPAPHGVRTNSVGSNAAVTPRAGRKGSTTATPGASPTPHKSPPTGSQGGSARPPTHRHTRSVGGPSTSAATSASIGTAAAPSTSRRTLWNPPRQPQFLKLLEALAKHAHDSAAGKALGAAAAAITAGATAPAALPVSRSMGGGALRTAGSADSPVQQASQSPRLSSSKSLPHPASPGAAPAAGAPPVSKTASQRMDRGRSLGGLLGGSSGGSSDVAGVAKVRSASRFASVGGNSNGGAVGAAAPGSPAPATLATHGSAGSAAGASSSASQEPWSPAEGQGQDRRHGSSRGGGAQAGPGPVAEATLQDGDTGDVGSTADAHGDGGGQGAHGLGAFSHAAAQALAALGSDGLPPSAAAAAQQAPNLHIDSGPSGMPLPAPASLPLPPVPSSSPFSSGGGRHPSGSSLRRRRGGGGDSGAAGSFHGGDDDVSGSVLSTRGNPALERWAFLREAVMDGRVAALPGRTRYSIVSATFKRLFPEEFDRAVPVIKHKEVDKLLMEVDKHMSQYEFAKLYEETYDKELYGRTGFCGLLGERVRLRHHHAQAIRRLLKEVEAARRRAFAEGATPSWFVFFKTQRAAAVASQCLLHAEDNRQFRVQPAPGPEEVNWPALWSSWRERDWRTMLVRPLVLLVVLFPVGIFTGGLMQLDYLLCPAHKCLTLQRQLNYNTTALAAAGCSEAVLSSERDLLTWEWYCQQDDFFARSLRRLVVGWVPSLLINLWQGMVLPICFTLLVQASRRCASLSEVDRSIARYMFYFAVFNVFLGGVVGSTIIQGINSAITRGPSEIFTLIGTYLPTSSNFFINYTLFRALVAVPLRMLWPHIGIRMYLLRRYLRFSRIITDREQAAFLAAPVSPRYGFEVGMVMLIFLIAFAFSLVSPILLPMALLFFFMVWLFWRWALLYVYVRKYEGGGTMWPFMFARIMVCMAVFPLFTACVLITKRAYVQAILLFASVPIMLVRFNTYCYYRFGTGVRAVPLELAAKGPIARVDPWVYMPPPLLTHLAGWNPDWAKAWQGWNMPVGYL